MLDMRQGLHSETPGDISSSGVVSVEGGRQLVTEGSGDGARMAEHGHPGSWRDAWGGGGGRVCDGATQPTRREEGDGLENARVELEPVTTR